MKNKLYLPILIGCLLISGCFASFASSQSSTDTATLTVTLNTPANNTIVTTTSSTLNQSFAYSPVINGTNDYYVIAKLYLNETETTSTNQTAIANNTANTLFYVFSSNATYLWNVKVYNSTTSVSAAENFTITINITTPSPTPTPAAAPTPSPTPVPTSEPTISPTATPSPTPSPTPEPPGFFTTTNLLIIIVVVLIIIIVVAALLLLRKH